MLHIVTQLWIRMSYEFLVTVLVSMPRFVCSSPRKWYSNTDVFFERTLVQVDLKWKGSSDHPQILGCEERHVTFLCCSVHPGAEKSHAGQFPNCIQLLIMFAAYNPLSWWNPTFFFAKNESDQSPHLPYLEKHLCCFTLRRTDDCSPQDICSRAYIPCRVLWILWLCLARMSMAGNLIQRGQVQQSDRIPVGSLMVGISFSCSKLNGNAPHILVRHMLYAGLGNSWCWSWVLQFPPRPMYCLLQESVRSLFPKKLLEKSHA
jgi:hypothetical protein